MSDRRCRYCQQVFQPARYHPQQAVCSQPACQRQRRRDYQRQKIASDPEYRKHPKLAVLTGMGGCVHGRIGGHLEKRADGYYWSERGAVASGTTFQGSSSSMRLMGWSGRRESTSRR